jgi:GDP-4-dehydro-6-deoxy-D-mannose reductase
MDRKPAPSALPVEDFLTVDICDGAAVRDAVTRLAPDACIHLAAIAFVPSGKACPEQMIAVNVMGTTHLLEAFRSRRQPARILCVSTAHVYGNSVRQAPVKEDDALLPDSLYGITKAAADGISRVYAREYGMHVMVARPYNHIGPGQAADYVVASFARQVAMIRRGASPLIRVGNLDSQRDFTDVRDIVRAYTLLLERGVPGGIYNIASGQQVGIGDVLSRLCDLAGVRPHIERDETLYRPQDGCMMLDITRLRHTTGWAPIIPLEKTLKDVVDQA